jgi:hypothetical protein
MIEGQYSATQKDGYRFDPTSKTYISTPGLVDFYLKCVQENRTGNMRFKTLKDAEGYLTKNMSNMVAKLKVDLNSIGSEDIRKIIDVCFNKAKAAQKVEQKAGQVATRSQEGAS